MFTGDEADYIWLAGFFDAEGSLVINPHRTKARKRLHPWYNAYIVISNTDIPLMEMIQKWLGGTLTYRTPKSPRSNPYARWSLSYRPAVPLLGKLFPYLRIKRQRTEVFLAFAATCGYRGFQGQGRSEEEWQLREELFLKMKALNKRGR